MSPAGGDLWKPPAGGGLWTSADKAHALMRQCIIPGMDDWCNFDIKYKRQIYSQILMPKDSIILEFRTYRG